MKERTAEVVRNERERKGPDLTCSGRGSRAKHASPSFGCKRPIHVAVQVIAASTLRETGFMETIKVVRHNASFHPECFVRRVSCSVRDCLADRRARHRTH